MMLTYVLLSVLTATALLQVCIGTYVVSYSNSLIPGIPLEIRVHVQNAAGSVNVRAGLKYVQNDTLIVENTTFVQNGLSTTLTLNVPATLIPTQYKIVASGSGGLVFQNESNIHFEEKSVLVFIQTDKSRYSAGQTVKYRAVLLLPNLRNFQGQATVTIQDGKDNRIEIIGPNQVENGVVSGEIELSTQPVFGTWKLIINATGISVSKTFEVNDYVLPRFNVEIDVPSAINATDSTFMVKVKAKFTFKADVLGNCTILLYNEKASWKHLQQHAELNGLATFTFQMSNVKRDLDINSKINIRATVMDHATFLMMVTESQLNIVNNNQPRVTITKVDAYKNSFVPGLTYHTKLFVGRNNQPIGKAGSLTITPTLTTATLRTCYKVSPPQKWLDVQTTTGQVMTVPFDVSGYADLSYLVDSDNAQKLLFSIKFRDTSVQSQTSYASVVLYALYPNGMPIIRVRSNKVKFMAGESVALTITATENLSGNLTFEVHSRGMRLKSENVAISNAASKTHSITVTKDMIPRAYMSVSHLTLSGYLVADYIIVEVGGNPLCNEVNVSFNAQQLQPGQNINMRITSDPYSTVYVLVEDQRNRILGTGNDIFQADVVSEIESAGSSVTENIQRSVNSRRKKRYLPDRKRKLIKRSHGSLGDLDDVYIESGRIIMSDAKVLEKNNYNDLLLYKGYEQKCVAPTTPKPPAYIHDAHVPFLHEMLVPDFSGSSSGNSKHISGGGISRHLYAAALLPGRPPAAAPPPPAAAPPPTSPPATAPPPTSPPATAPPPTSPPGANEAVTEWAKPLSLSEILRSRFPETWIWDEYSIGVSGEIDISKQVPDSLTTWVTSVFATNPNTGFGIADEKQTFLVEKKFFLTLDLPPSIVLGEEFLLQITTFNYDEFPKQVFLQITLSDNPYAPIPAVAQVQEGEGKSTYVIIKPENIGTLSVTVMAKVGFFSSLVPDILTKNVTVRPNGVFRTTNEQVLVDVTSDQDPYTKTIVLDDPEDMIDGTKFTKITVTGDFMIPSVEGLGELVRLPYGCGEQTMLNFAPAIYITKYLSIVGKLTKEIQEKATKSLKKGLQNELSYQRRDGSFSAFGNSDSSGSSWLTAFVLKCFGQATGHINIDKAVMSKAMNWLLNCQRSNGEFSEPGRVIHYQMQAGTASGTKMAAFILIALVENRNTPGVQVSRLNTAIRKGKQYLESQLYTASNAYTLAILCYALASADSASSSTCYTKLRNAALLDDDKTYWTATSPIAKRSVNKHSLTKRAPSADIEATSYALLTYMKLEKTSEAFRVVKWLVSQRNPTGGWLSTQDTIVSLQALTEFSSSYGSNPGPDYGVQFNIMSFQNFQHTYSTTPTTIDVIHTKEVPDTVDNIIIQAIGEGSAVIDISTSYYVSGNENNDYIAVNVSISSETIHTITVYPCLTWTGPDQSGMLIMEVEMPTGFKPDNDFLKAQSKIKRHETRGRNIAIYLDGVNPNGKICLNVKMDRADAVVKSQACHVTVYDYYEPSHQAMTRYESGFLKSSNICMVCPLCEFCTGSDGGGQIGVGR